MTDTTYFANGTLLQERYEILEEIGRGGYSVVYRARDRRIGTDVAIAGADAQMPWSGGA